MKKYIFAAFALFTLSCSFVACSDDDEDEVISYSTTPEKASAGTYTGTWTKEGEDGTNTFDGTVTLVATDSVRCTDITFSCPGASLEKSSVANVWNSGRGFQFVNQLETNGLGTAFAGRISENGVLTTAFTISEKVGRITKKFNYTFEGRR
jgi:hypothetical protein